MSDRRATTLLGVHWIGGDGLDRALLYSKPQRRIKDYILGPQVQAIVKEHRHPYLVGRMLNGAVTTRKEAVVRSTFNIELRVDIGQLDEQRRKAFIDLTIMTARQFYSQAAMVSSTTPIIKVTSLDRENGQEDYSIIDNPDRTQSESEAD